MQCNRTVEEQKEGRLERLTTLCDFFSQNQIMANLIGDRCIVNCKLNDFINTVLIYAGAQVCLLAKSWLKHHHPNLTIKEFHNVLDKTDQLRVRWGNSSKISFVGYVHMAFQLNHQSTPLIQGSFISEME